MKLLRELVRLRAAGRGLFSVRRDAHRRSYVVTVPPPLSETDPVGRGMPAAAAGHAVCESVSARLSSPRNLFLAASR